MTTRDLESRYRRLLAVYPWEHRRRYAEEMLAVLMAGARPGQRRPSLGEVVDLTVGGLRTRLGLTTRGLTDPAWADGATVTGLIAALVLFALGGRAALVDLVPGDSTYRFAGVSGLDWLRVAGWGTVSIAALVGLRRSAAGLAWATVLAQGTLLALRYATDPVPVVGFGWQFTLGVVAAVALSVPATRRRAVAVLGVRRLVAIVAALAAVDAVFLVERLARPAPRVGEQITTYVFHFDWLGRPDSGLRLEAGTSAMAWLYLLGLAVAVLVLLVAVATVAAPVRRRVVVLLAPVVALAVLVGQTLDGWMFSNQQFTSPIHLVAGQWVGLVAVPLLIFAVGVLLLRRREQTLRLAELGRAVDREQPLA